MKGELYIKQSEAPFDFKFINYQGCFMFKVWNVRLQGKWWQKSLFYLFVLVILTPIALCIDVLILAYKAVKMFVFWLFDVLDKSIRRLIKRFIKSFLGRVFSITAVIFTILFFYNLFESGKWHELAEKFGTLFTKLFLW